MSELESHSSESTRRRRGSTHESHGVPAVTVTLAASLAPPDDTAARRRHSFTPGSTSSAATERHVNLQHRTTTNGHLLNVDKSTAARRASFDVARAANSDNDKYAVLYTDDIKTSIVGR